MNVDQKDKTAQSDKTALSGLLLIDKPLGPTSHDVVDDLRRALGQKSVGHTGSLDPLASGLLVMCLGRATKISKYITLVDKTYEAQITLGKCSKTFDAEGLNENESPGDVSTITEDIIENALKTFIGKTNQTVPIYSAVKVDGKKRYKSARKGEEVVAPTREIVINKIKLLSYVAPTLSIMVDCESGVYIRSLANDIGEALGCGAYLSGLRRTRVGAYSVEDGMKLADIEAAGVIETIKEKVISISESLELPSIAVSDAFAQRIEQGRTLTSSDLESIETPFEAGQEIAIRDSRGKALAVGISLLSSDKMRESDAEQIFKYSRVL